MKENPLAFEENSLKGKPPNIIFVLYNAAEFKRLGNNLTQTAWLPISKDIQRTAFQAEMNHPPLG